jgi:hypothetical protein
MRRELKVQVESYASVLDESHEERIESMKPSRTVSIAEESHEERIEST